jgi:formylglycine-generating enzyme required for sulfatase activity
LGLIPLGRDPRSGLFEFLHWASHEGNIPTRQTTGEVVLTEVSGILLVLLPGAEEFWMGAQTDPQGKNFDPNAEDSEGPVNEVHLGPFFMSKYLMTQGQWLRTTGGNPSRYRPETGDFTLLHPVEDVSWNDCSEVLQHLGLEIPTEAQWEYAARGGTSSVYWTGNEPNSILRGACLLGTFKGGRHAPVGSFEPNPFGLYDVIGNVWEWTRDSYAPYHQPARPGDGLRMEAGEYIALRGCSFFNRAEQARVAYRTDDCTRDKRHAWLGVRPSCALQDGPT